MRFEKIEMLPGRSAQEWDRVHTAVQICGWLLVGLMIPFAIAGSQGLSWSWVVALSLFVVGITAVSWSNAGPSPLARRDRREVEAGYTTTPLPHRPGVALVDYQTGVVLRRGGEPALTREEYRAAAMRARSGS